MGYGNVRVMLYDGPEMTRGARISYIGPYLFNTTHLGQGNTTPFPTST